MTAQEVLAQQKQKILDYWLVSADRDWEVAKSLLQLKRYHLFGSVAKGNDHDESDIDVAVISDQFGRDYWQERQKVDRLARLVNTSIEVHLFSTDDFSNPYDGIAAEIKKTGIVI